MRVYSTNPYTLNKVVASISLKDQITLWDRGLPVWPSVLVKRDTGKRGMYSNELEGYIEIEISYSRYETLLRLKYDDRYFFVPVCQQYDDMLPNPTQNGIRFAKEVTEAYEKIDLNSIFDALINPEDHVWTDSNQIDQSVWDQWYWKLIMTGDQ